MYRLILFDMDGTLLNGRTIFHIAENKGFKEKLFSILNQTKEPYLKSIEIAHQLKGLEENELIDIFNEIPLRQYVFEIFEELKSNDFIIAIATDSYDFIVKNLSKRLGVTQYFANNLKFMDGICTGELQLHNTKLVRDDVTKQIYSISKSCVLDDLCKQYEIPIEQTIAVGDGIVDCGMIQKAGLGIAINASDEVNKYADVITNELNIISSHLHK